MVLVNDDVNDFSQPLHVELLVPDYAPLYNLLKTTDFTQQRIALLQLIYMQPCLQQFLSKDINPLLNHHASFQTIIGCTYGEKLTRMKLYQPPDRLVFVTLVHR